MILRETTTDIEIFYNKNVCKMNIFLHILFVIKHLSIIFICDVLNLFDIQNIKLLVGILRARKNIENNSELKP